MKRRDLERSHLLEALVTRHALDLLGVMTFELQAHREDVKPAKASLAMPLRGHAGFAGETAYGTADNQLHGEFDPGSGRTLAARLTHASRAITMASAMGRAANG